MDGEPIVVVYRLGTELENFGWPTVAAIPIGERWQSAARDLGLSIGTDFIASPLHRLVRRRVQGPVRPT
jgi:hypothetical protein